MTQETQWTATGQGVLAALGPAPRIAILRGGGFGDFLSTTAALRALRESVPEAHITLLTSSVLAGFVSRYDALDRVVVAPPYPGVISGEPDGDCLAHFFEVMREERFDLVLQWHGGGQNSNPFVSRLGARITAGFRAQGAPTLDYWLPYDEHHHEILRYLDLARLLGAEGSDIRTYLPVLASDLEELAAMDDAVNLEGLRQGRYIGLHASAGAPSRRWSSRRYAWVLDRLLEEFDFDSVLITAGTGQEGDSAAVVEAMGHGDRAIDLGGKLSLGALVALISKLPFLLTNDSGPAHMAVALGTPSLVVFGAANPLNWGPLDRTWHRLVAAWHAPCRWMPDDGCANTQDAECLLSMQPEVVLREARQLLHLLGRMRVRTQSWAEQGGRPELEPRVA